MLGTVYKRCTVRRRPSKYLWGSQYLPHTSTGGKIKYTKEFAKSQILKLSKELEKTPTRKEYISKKYKPSIQTIKTKWGWTNLIKELNLNINKGYNKDFVKNCGGKTIEKIRENMIYQLFKLCKKVKRRPTYKEIDNCSYTPCICSYFIHFGSIENALKKVAKHGNFDIITKRKKYSEKSILNEFYRVKKVVGQVPTKEEMAKISKITPYYIQRQYGSWWKFLNKIHEQRKYEYSNYGIKKRTFISEDGHICDSKREMEIDNVLYKLGIEHEKGVYYPFDEEYNKLRRMTADWKIGDTYIEYCGLVFCNIDIIRKSYNKTIRRKMNMCMNRDWNFLHITPDTLKNIEKDIKEWIGEEKCME